MGGAEGRTGGGYYQIAKRAKRALFRVRGFWFLNPQLLHVNPRCDWDVSWLCCGMCQSHPYYHSHFWSWHKVPAEVFFSPERSEGTASAASIGGAGGGKAPPPSAP